MVEGQMLMRDRQVTTDDEAAVRTAAQAKAIARHAVADPVHEGLALLAAMAAGQVWLDTDVNTENTDQNWLPLASMGKAEDF